MFQFNIHTFYAVKDFVFCLSYGGKCSDSIRKLRYGKYLEMVTTSSSLQPQKLPPTVQAIRYHSMRVQLQVCQWKYLDLMILDARNWGWKDENGCMTPIKTDTEPAPEWLLKVIRCRCNMSSKNPCGTAVCSCRKNGIKCMSACSNCCGESCTNATVDDIIEDDLDDCNADGSDFERNIFDIFD